MNRVATPSSSRARSSASIGRFCFGLLVSAFVLNGCGGGSSSPVSPISPVSTIAPQQQQHFAVPQALHRAVPPAPPNFVPPLPDAAQLAAAKTALHDAVLKVPAGVRRLVSSASASPSPVVRFHTIEGDIDVQLRPDVAPKNVANFLSYVNGGSYNNSIFHRSQSGFIIQGGGYYVNQGQLDIISAQPAVTNEFDLSNVRGTLAMALSGSNINSATDQWFFNLANNASQIDSGKYTVIGSILNSQGLAVMDAIGGLQVVDASASFGPAFTQLPVVNYSGTVSASNLVYVNSITQQVAPEFFAGESSLGNGVYYLAFSDGNYFGYYSYLSDPHYIYHFDLGYEYIFDANDGHDGIYLYDFASNTFFYTSPSYPFPYLYDFTLNSVLYYYPATSNAGHYTSNPRYFFEFKTGTIITK